MKSYTTLAEALQDRAQDTQCLTFIQGQDKETQVPYKELYSRALSRLAALQSRGIVAGDQLILLLADNEQFIVSFWAAILGGIVPVPIAGGSSDEHKSKLFRVFQKLNSGFLLTESTTLERLKKYALEHSMDDEFSQLQQRTLLELVDRPDDAGVIHVSKPEDTALIQFSSGSTSTPKGVVLTHKNLLTNIAAIIRGMALRSDDKFLSWMPLTHDMGLIGFHLTPAVAGIDHALMPTDLFVRRAALWLTKSDSLGSTILCSPNFGYEHYLKSFSKEKSVGLDLSKVRLIFNGAEPISDELCDQFLSTMAPYGLKNQSMYTVYGLAEASLAVTFPPLETSYTKLRLDRKALSVGKPVRVSSIDDPDGITFVNVGAPVDNCELMICDADGSQLPEQAVGHIKIRGDNVTAGYYQEDAINAETITPDGWLDTGDLGFISHRKLYITGRAKDIIFVNGLNFYPHDLERILIDGGQIDYGKIAITSYRSASNREDKVLCFIQARTDLKDVAIMATEIKKTINVETGVPIEHVIPVQRIPKTTSGKVQRFRLAQNYLEGEYQDTLNVLSQYNSQVSHSDSDDSSISAQLTQICLSQIDDIPLTTSDNLFEIGISSLTLAQIHEKIETTWPDQVDITDLFDYPSINELAVFLEDKLTENA